MLGPRPARPARLGSIGDAVSGLARAYPRAVVAWAAIGIPVMLGVALLPAPLSWIGWLVAYTIAAGAALGAAAPARPSVRAGLTIAIGLVVPLTLAGLLLGGALVAVVVPTILIVSAVEAGLFGAYLVLLVTVAILARFPLMLPAIVQRRMPAIDALELSWDLAGGAFVEIAALLAVLLAVALGPLVVVATIAAAAGAPDAAMLVLTGVALAVTGPLLPLAFAALLDPLEARRRELDPTFGRP